MRRLNEYEEIAVLLNSAFSLWYILRRRKIKNKWKEQKSWSQTCLPGFHLPVAWMTFPFQSYYEVQVKSYEEGTYHIAGYIIDAQ